MNPADARDPKAANLQPGTLYVVSTPIGNLGDTTTRTVDSLRSVDAIACEDTRVTGKLLKHLGVEPHPPLRSYRDENEQVATPGLLAELQSGKVIALVADAGTPTISDPGFRLVRACRAAKVPVIPVPGPTAAVAALSVSGLPTDQFLFLGFLPPKKAARLRCFENHKKADYTLVFYESTHRIEKFLDDLKSVLGPERNIFIGREISKLHETYLSGTVAEVRAALSQRSSKGEFVVCIAREGFSL